MPRVTFEPIVIRTDSQDRVGRLAKVDGELVAVLVRLDARSHIEEQRGKWFLEAGFGPCGWTRSPSFEDLEAAATWIGALAVGKAVPERTAAVRA